MAMSSVPLDSLRSLVQDSLGKHMYENAIFFADKLVTLSHSDPDDVYRLAQAYVYTKQYRRALHTLNKAKLATSNPRFRYLTALCLFECQEYDECLAALDDEALRAAAAEAGAAGAAGVQGHISMLSAMQLLKGSVCECQENWPVAARCYIAALHNDPLCFEALDRLVTNHMISVDEQRSLLRSLEASLTSRDAEWLLLYYRCKLEPSEGQALAEAYANVPHALEPAGADDGDDDDDAAFDEGELPAAVVELRGNCELMTAAAEYEYAHDNFRRCRRLSSLVLAKDPFQKRVLPVHVCSMMRLDMHADLFFLAHQVRSPTRSVATDTRPNLKKNPRSQTSPPPPPPPWTPTPQLVEEYPTSAVSWYAVGCYYHMIADFENARRYFSKSTTLDHRFAPAWVGFGHAFAAQDESDQAMAAYRTASRLFSGCHIPWLGIGMECLRTNHLPLAMQYIRQAEELSPNEPLVLHELGTLHLLNGELDDAIDFFHRVADSTSYDESLREPSIFNLGHAYRKKRDFPNAIKWYRAALAINPRVPSTYSALGFALHLSGDLAAAIELYHQSLSLKPDDTFT